MADVPAYTREALVRDLIASISWAEGKPIHLGGAPEKQVDRSYIANVATFAIDIVSRLSIKTS
jgi:hypothetical protein